MIIRAVSIALVCLVVGGLASHALSASRPSQEFIAAEIRAMIAEKVEGPDYELLQVSSSVNGLVAVAIQPPYREFPNVIFFEYVKGKWRRVFEGLTIGLQPQRGRFLDLHTTGFGVDALVGGRRSYKTEKVLAAAWKTGMVVTRYRNFLHMHPGGKKLYFIDKTMFYDIGVRLFGKVYEEYKKDDCMIYDMPPLKDIGLSYAAGSYKLIGTTENGQVWRVLFSGVEDGRYLSDKKIVANKSGGNAASIRPGGMAEKMTKRLLGNAEKYEEYAPVPRIALFDLAFGAGLEEHNKLQRHGVVMVTAVSQDKNELPIARVYVVSDGKERELRKLCDKTLLVKSSQVRYVLGGNRVDSCYLLPYSLSRRGGVLQVDWQANREGMALQEFPFGEALPFVKDTKAEGGVGDIDQEALREFLRREFGVN